MMNNYILLLLLMSLLLSSCEKTSIPSQKINLIQAADFNRKLGLAYLKENNFSEAQKKLFLAKQQDPKSIKILMALAYLFQQTRQVNLAKIYYERALSFEGNNSEVLNNFGAFLCKQGDYQKGIYLLKKAKVTINTYDYDIASIDHNLLICTFLDPRKVFDAKKSSR